MKWHKTLGKKWSTDIRYITEYTMGFNYKLNFFENLFLLKVFQSVEKINITAFGLVKSSLQRKEIKGMPSSGLIHKLGKKETLPGY